MRSERLWLTRPEFTGPFQRPPCPSPDRQGRQGFHQVLNGLDGAFLLGISGVVCFEGLSFISNGTAGRGKNCTGAHFQRVIEAVLNEIRQMNLTKQHQNASKRTRASLTMIPSEFISPWMNLGKEKLSALLFCFRDEDNVIWKNKTSSKVRLSRYLMGSALPLIR